ncbi:MAG: hypothetical protein AAF674_06675 [Pseudomonadota bacterium]
MFRVAPGLPPALDGQLPPATTVCASGWGPRGDQAAHVCAGRALQPFSPLDSQLATLEPLSPEEHAVAIDIGAEPEALVAEILRRLERSGMPAAS